MNPEKMVIKESQRALTYLSMYGLMVDAVIVNRILPVDKDSGYINTWKAVQQKHLTEIVDSFSPLPIKHVPMYPSEVVGLEALTNMGEDIYGENDATDFMYHSTALRNQEKQNRLRSTDAFAVCQRRRAGLVA